MDCEGRQAMDGAENSGRVHRTPRRAPDVKRKSKKKREAKPEDGDDVCAICDDGGYVTCCDGGCLRSFHLTEEHGEGSKCPSLGLTSEQAKMIIDKKDFICNNCKYKQHQCSACGLLGSSDLSSGAEVFKCKNYACGHFYHPKCISKLRHPNKKHRASLFEQNVAAGLKFLCHVHKCSVCHGKENKDDKDMQFAVCRLCPTTYHRKCLPSDILFEGKEGPNGYIFQRAWDGILRDQTLIYCMKHEIIKDLGIPGRKLIIFPDSKKPLVPKGPESAPKEQDIVVQEELLDHPSSGQDILVQEELLDHPSSGQDILVQEELLDHPSPEPSQTPPPPATVQNQWCYSNPMASFAPSSLHTRPYPGSCGWIDD